MGQSARIWVDADACPKALREIILKAAKRVAIKAIFVANHNLGIPITSYSAFVQVSSGFDVADDYIAEQISAGDLLISNDIPLADQAITAGALVINMRGEELTQANIKSRLNLRDFMDTMRSSGVQTGGPPPLSQRDRANFANALDRFLTRL
ncbi:MAG: YaiI/YqxD family protein [Aequoribacter sp.]|uniref:YaiI/YqxD family protein n=1 Tax=Aequoribacter sp. TaxID=2847771 RepID=UPI003C5A56B0